MLTIEETERIINDVVEKDRQHYTNAELWAWLTELNDRENQIVKLIPMAYRLAHSWRDDYQQWRRYWNSILNESSTNRPVIDCIILHLTRRGDEAVAGWLCKDAEFKRHLAMQGQRAAWRLDCD